MSRRSLDWREDASCLGTDPEAFFPDKGDSPRPAKRVCDGCSVRQPCLDHALANNEVGVWGGTSGVERRRLKAGRSGR